MYRYGRILGSGYFGKVHMAYHRLSGGKVAIKTLRKKEYLRAKMDWPPREIAVLKAIEHPHIYRLLDTVTLSDRIHLVLEFVEGRELCEIVETESIPEEVARYLWRQILTGVAYLHDNNIVHRDLKLENIIVDRRGNCKIIDLGFGNFIMNSNHLLRTFCGSPDYAAPELFSGAAYNGFQSDCWSLGALLYALLTGQLPFKGGFVPGKSKLHFPEFLSASGGDIIRRILRPDPKKRLTVHEMLLHPWTCQGYPGAPTQPLPIIDEIIPEILTEMETLGMDPDTTCKSLENKEFNQFTTTYFLLLKAHLANQPDALGRIPAFNPKSTRKRTEDCLLI